MKLRGKTWKYGDNINTDLIIPGKYLQSRDIKVLVKHAMEDIDPHFTSKISPGDIMVAGVNFGCGSSRENAPAVLKEAGISAIVAVSFARIFFRNAINIGLPVMECAMVEKIAEGQELQLYPMEGLIYNFSTCEHLTARKLPEIILEILGDGGLVASLSKKFAQ